jgi:hypothetical protein
MNEKNTKKLFDRFKFFKPKRPMTEGLMCFGFACGDGWFDLIWKLCEDIEKLDPSPEFEVLQVKEKFGGLRFYPMGVAKEETWNRINEAENESYKICEVCGKPGALRKGG